MHAARLLNQWIASRLLSTPRGGLRAALACSMPHLNATFSLHAPTHPALHLRASGQLRCSPLRSLSRAIHPVAGAIKKKVDYECPACGQLHLQKLSNCPNCGAKWVTMTAVERIKSSKQGGGPSSDTYIQEIKRSARQTYGGSGPDTAPAQAPRMQRNSWVDTVAGLPRPVPDILLDDSYGPERVPLKGKCGQEISRVLGGGFVKGSLVLIAGEPGIGKSTLLMQLAALVAHPEMDHDKAHLHSYEALADTSERLGSDEEGGEVPDREGRDGADEDDSDEVPEEQNVVLYVSGEEGERQVADRANRLGLGSCSRLLLMSATCLDHILATMYAVRPTAVIVDSIQTVYLERHDNSAGSPTQVRESTAMLKRIATETRAVVFIVGHVTKAGDVAGPKTVEHAVDTVLTLHGDTQSPYRLLRATKNRYGSPSEVGIFSMERCGMRAVENPSEAFLSEREGHEPGVGTAVGCFIRGNRPIMLELQSLVTARQQQGDGGGSGGNPGPVQRLFTGVDRNNASKVVEIVQKHVKINLNGANIFINVVADQEIKDASGDLVIALALVSSATGKAMPPDLCAVGEIDLAGRLRQVREAQQVERLVAEAARMGFRRIILPAISVKDKQGSLQKQFQGTIQVIPCRTVGQAIYAALG